MTEKLIISENQGNELLAFLVTSSRGVIEEPELYGSFRLMDAASLLLGFMLESGKQADEEFLQQLKNRIDTCKMLVMSDEEQYLAFTEDVVRSVTQRLKAQAS